MTLRIIFGFGYTVVAALMWSSDWSTLCFLETSVSFSVTAAD